MTLINTFLLILVVITAAVSLLVLLVVTNIVELRNPSNSKALYSTLVVSLLFLVLLLFAKAFFSHNVNLQSDNGNECEKEDPPFWCYLDSK